MVDGRRVWIRAGTAALTVSLLTACARLSIKPIPPPAPAGAGAWSDFALPGKRMTTYRHVEWDGRRVVRAQADASASMYRQAASVEPGQLGTVDFSWWVPELMPKADLTDRDAADSPVRIVLAFDGDRSKLSAKNRLLFELAETLSGEPPPYATLMYVWDNRAALESVIPGGRSDRIRKIVVDSGPGGLKTWRHHRREIVRDFERAFGEAPGRLIGVGLLTDSDNTGSRTEAFYGDFFLTGSDGLMRVFND